MKKSKTVDMCNGPLLKKIIVFTIPILLSGVLQLLFNAVDMVVVGRFCGSNSLAAVGSVGPLFNLITGLFMGLSVGSGILISHAVGAGKKKEIDRVLHTSVIASIIGGIFIAMIGVILSRQMLILMDTPPEVLDKATLYLRIIFVGMPICAFYNFCATMLRSSGDSFRPLIYLVIGGLANVVLNVLLVTLVNLDVAGVAIATVISQALSATLILIRLIKGTEYLKLQRRKLHISKPHLIKILKIGLPAGIQGTIFSLSNVIIQSSVNSFGAVAVAGNSAGASIDGFLYMSMNSFYNTALTFSGQNMGARKPSRIIRTLIQCLILVTLLGVGLGIFVITFSEPLLSIYCPGNLDAIAIGTERLKIFGSFYFLCGIMETFTGILRGMGRSLTTMIISIIGVCGVRIVWIYTVFARIRTLSCLYMSFVFSWLLVVVVSMIVFTFIIKKFKNEVKADGLNQ